MAKWEIEVVEKRVTEISQSDFEMRLEEILKLLLKKEDLSMNGLAPIEEETA